jgi:hypothetical protein
LSFGHGSHYCVGANIARMELRLMIDAALDFIPQGARLLEDEIRWSKKGFMSQIKSLPVDFASRNNELDEAWAGPVILGSAPESKAARPS